MKRNRFLSNPNAATASPITYLSIRVQHGTGFRRTYRFRCQRADHFRFQAPFPLRVELHAGARMNRGNVDKANHEAMADQTVRFRTGRRRRGTGGKVPDQFRHYMRTHPQPFPGRALHELQRHEVQAPNGHVRTSRTIRHRGLAPDDRGTLQVHRTPPHKIHYRLRKEKTGCAARSYDSMKS